MEQEMTLKDKRILFLAPAFFGYEKAIQSKMEEMGAKVDFYDERSITKPFHRALLKISSAIFRKQSNRYFKNIIDKNKYTDYEYVLIMSGDMLTEHTLKLFRSSFPKTIFCLYLDDSVRNNKGVAKKFKYFDRVLSFDRKDTFKYESMKFRPLFYTDSYKKEVQTHQEYEYDITFCGTIHSDRFAMIREVKKICQENQLIFNHFSYLQGKFIYYFYKITKREFISAKKSDFSFEKMSSQEIATMVEKSRTMLDVQHPAQSGLTIRTIEMLGMNKKLVTTNAEIKEYDFYNPNNILVIDRKNVKISADFLLREYEPIAFDIYNKYSIAEWIKDVLYAVD